MKRKIHPKSLANLTHMGRPPIHGEAKQGRKVRVTRVGWSGLQAIAARLGLSVSELLEQLGRGQFEVRQVDMP
ncbi:MAG: hypothetical protein KME12_15415 [Trichocoleus desertorum ATA4-8-CV12]|jgi:hypothetical protein|nr:hypothetical protein [Trichocoleus desertorum ATA4-8-CV12]